MGLALAVVFSFGMVATAAAKADVQSGLTDAQLQQVAKAVMEFKEQGLSDADIAKELVAAEVCPYAALVGVAAIPATLLFIHLLNWLGSGKGKLAQWANTLNPAKVCGPCCANTTTKDE